MTPSNDMPADTELREAILDILVARSGDKEYAKLFERHNVEPLMQLIKQRDKARDAAIRIDELEKWLPVADTWAKQEGIYGPQIQFKRRIAELSAPTDQKEKE